MAQPDWSGLSRKTGSVIRPSEGGLTGAPVPPPWAEPTYWSRACCWRGRALVISLGFCGRATTKAVPQPARVVPALTHAEVVCRGRRGYGLGHSETVSRHGCIRSYTARRSLAQRVIEGVCDGADRWDQSGQLQRFGEMQCSVLRSGIRVMNRVSAQRMAFPGPTDHGTPEPAHHRHIGEVGHPHVIGPGGAKAAMNQIRGAHRARNTFGGTYFAATATANGPREPPSTPIRSAQHSRPTRSGWTAGGTPGESRGIRAASTSGKTTSTARSHTSAFRRPVSRT